jgi:transcriptional regulator with XRE-family HTH domain
MRRLRPQLALHHRTPQTRRHCGDPIRGSLMATPLSAMASSNLHPPAGATAEDPAVALRKGLGRKLFDRRKQCGMTRAELARRMRYPYIAIFNVERGNQLGSLRFWALADAALQANGTLLDTADRTRPQVVTAKQHPEPEPDQPATEALKLAPYRQTQKTHRVFADRLSTTAAHRRRCPHMAETAAHQRTRIEHELEALTATIRTLQRRPDFTPNEVFTDLWQTLLTHDPYHASFLGAAALTELARTRP